MYGVTIYLLKAHSGTYALIVSVKNALFNCAHSPVIGFQAACRCYISSKQQMNPPRQTKISFEHC